ncbi:MAG: hypothetical protein HY293_05820 [Planctomycetes bacterium]|nr:hypothetical protein [Planctomycetota bacterium]
MASRGELRVRIQGDRFVEGRVQSIITRFGARVEEIQRRTSPNGRREHSFSLAFPRDSVLDQIVGALGGLPGVEVLSVTLGMSVADRKPMEERRHE